MFILLTVFPMACKKANKVDSATILTQLHKVLRFPTIYLPLFHAVKTIFVQKKSFNRICNAQYILKKTLSELVFLTATFTSF